MSITYCSFEPCGRPVDVRCATCRREVCSYHTRLPSNVELADVFEPRLEAVPEPWRIGVRWRIDLAFQRWHDDGGAACSDCFVKRVDAWAADHIARYQFPDWPHDTLGRAFVVERMLDFNHEHFGRSRNRRGNADALAAANARRVPGLTEAVTNLVLTVARETCPWETHGYKGWFRDGRWSAYRLATVKVDSVDEVSEYAVFIDDDGTTAWQWLKHLSWKPAPEFLYREVPSLRFRLKDHSDDARVVNALLNVAVPHVGKSGRVFAPLFDGEPPPTG